MADEAVLRLTLYVDGSDLHQSDQITVPSRTWRNLYHGHDGETGRPLFVDIRSGDQWRPLVVRIRPAGLGELEDEHSCRIPAWMWIHLGAPEEGAWLTLATTPVAEVGTVVLRPRQEAGEDLVEVLTAALTGAAGAASWAVLCAGAELPLNCGVFDVVGLRSMGGADLAAGCILDHDVTLELEPVTRVATPPLPSFGGMSFPGMASAQTRTGGYILFGGTGHTLGGSR